MTAIHHTVVHSCSAPSPNPRSRKQQQQYIQLNKTGATERGELIK